MKVVRGENNIENPVWLQRSLVGESTKLINFNLISDWLLSEKKGVSEVREMGSYMALITFVSNESMEEALSDDNEW